MAEGFTTIRVYRSDKKKLLDRYEWPAHEAMRRLLTKTCVHPEEKRTYAMATLQVGKSEVLEAITSQGEQRSVGGFFCSECGTYIFRPLTAPALTTI